MSLALLGLILAKYLSVEEFGVTRTVASYMVVLTMFGHMTIHDAIATHVASTENNRAKSQYVIHGSLIVIVLSTLLATAFHFFVINSGMWTGLTRELLATVVLILPFECLSIVIMSLLNASGKIHTMAFFSVVCGAVPLGIIAPCAALWGINGWITARLVSCCIVFGLGVYLVRDYICICRMDIPKVLELIRFSRVQFVSGALSTVMLSGDIIALERLTRDSREVGQYGLAVLFSRPLAFIPAALGKLYFKEIASRGRDVERQWDSIGRLLMLTLGASSLFASLIFFFGESILRILYGTQYQAGARVLEILSVSIIFSGLWSAMSTTNIALKEPSFSVMTSIIGLIVGASMFALFVPTAGAAGAAWSINTAYSTGCVIGLALLWKKWHSSKTLLGMPRVP